VQYKIARVWNVYRYTHIVIRSGVSCAKLCQNIGNGTFVSNDMDVLQAKIIGTNQ